eukprot:Seg1295.1 transcript_id=Seg1295.1/GoldUCD/mRNA.D3Y31 product="Cytosolic Fe-S cluster assembly factor NUBP1-like" protein_id=Seg1295.1/GoldUCD/D3Y31
MDTDADTSITPLQECPAESEQAGKADVCQGCPGQALCKSMGGVDPDQKLIDIRMKAIKHKILVLSGKGGVGKSSIASLLSMALGRQNKSVGLCDLDICGPSIPHLLDVKEQQVLDTPYGWQPLKSPHFKIKVMSVGSLLEESDNAVVWRGPRKTGIIKRFLKDTFWGRLDFLVFDTPPGTSDEHLTVVKALKNVSPDGAVIVTTPQDIALNTIRKEINFCKKMNLRIIGIISNMSGYVCPCCNEQYDLFVNKGTEKLCDEYGIKFLGRLPFDKEFVACCEQGASIFDKEGSRMADEVSVITEEILSCL